MVGSLEVVRNVRLWADRSLSGPHPASSESSRPHIGPNGTPIAVMEKLGTGHSPTNLHTSGAYRCQCGSCVDSVLVARRLRETDATDQVAETR